MLPSKLGIPLDGDVVEIVDTPFLEFLREELGDVADNLVTYFVKTRSRYCLGIWRDQLSGHVHEIKSWSDESELTEDTVNFVRYFLSDERRKDLLQYSKDSFSEDRAARNDAADRAEERLDRYRHLQRKLPEPRRFAPGSAKGRL